MSSIDKLIWGCIEGIGKGICLAVGVVAMAVEGVANKAAEARERRRLAAVKELNDAVTEAENRLEDSRAAVAAAVERSLGQLDSAPVQQICGHDVSAFGVRAEEIRRQIEQVRRAAEEEFDAAKKELAACRADERASVAEVRSLRAQLKKLNTDANVALPAEEISRLREDESNTKAALEQYAAVEEQMRALGKNEKLRHIAEGALRDSCGTRVTSAADVAALAVTMQEHITEALGVAYELRTADKNASVSRLSGMMDSCLRLREEQVKATYSAISFGKEAVERANKVWELYRKLQDAPYTTCEAEKLRETLRFAQEIRVRGDADESELERLEWMIDGYSRYKTQDELQEANYEDYCKKTAELREFDLSDEFAAVIRPFDPYHYDEQKEQLTELLIGMDERLAAERTEAVFARGCDAMEKAGFRPLLYDRRDPLACEAVFVRPGCKGVAWQIIASDRGLRRRLVGIRRDGGFETAPERILEVARLEEKYGSDVQFFDEYAAQSEDAEVVDAVLSDTEGSEEAIRRNGCIALDAAACEKYDELVGGEDARWASRVSGQMRREARDFVNSADCIEETGRRTRAAIAKARRSGS